jgi:hypothetical protein
VAVAERLKDQTINLSIIALTIFHMPVRNRNTLKNFFRNGKSPSEMEFSDLIDSTWNKMDDGMSRADSEGLKLPPTGNSSTIMSFYEGITDPDPNWQIAINPDNNNGLVIAQPGKEKAPAMVFADSGRVGIKTFSPRVDFEVAGNISSTGRTGGLRIGKIPADAHWHTVVAGLKGFNAFEIVAAAEGNAGEGNYSMAHAIALNANQGGRGTVKVITSTYGWFDFRDKIRFRWKGSPDKYVLQIRTGKHYFLTGDKKLNYIRFHICSLWDSAVMKKID